MNYLIVGIGGIIGAILRYLTGKVFMRIIKKEHPIATFFVNIVGSFLIGYFSMKHFSAKYKLFLMTGLLGGFTTYSTFMLESVRYMKNGRLLKTFIYIFVLLLFGILACGLGFWLARLI